jgi:hypothetical protein
MNTWKLGTLFSIFAMLLSVTSPETAYSQLVDLGSRTEITRRSITRVSQTQGELEVAVSDNGQNIVVAVNNLVGNPPFTQKTVFFSNDGGQTFQPSSLPHLVSSQPTLVNRRDPTVARGGLNKFYYAALGGSNILLGSSTDSGATFNFVSNDGAKCQEDSGASKCTSDQPHIAADPRAGNENTLYVVWRETDNFPDGRNIETAMIQCSLNGGATWQTPQSIGKGILVRMTVGADGIPYAIFADRRTGNGSIFIQRFTPCDANLANSLKAAFLLDVNSRPLKVVDFVNVPCPVPGLDRCNDGNILSSPTLAVDAANPQNIYVVYANRTANGNENIMVAADSNRGNGGFPASLRQQISVPTNVPARRFLPWACGGKGEIFAGWYDRRSANAANNDNTEYFVRSLQMQTQFTNEQTFSLRTSNEISLSGGVPDSQCASGWPHSPRNSGDSENCSVQPQFAGVCHAGGSGTCSLGEACPVGTRCSDGACIPTCSVNNCGSNATCRSGFCIPNTRLDTSRNAPRCDFSNPNCAAGETCVVGRGLPKYGDYNGFACADSKAFVAWASATVPGGLSLPNTGLNVFLATVEARRVPNRLGFCANNPSLCVDKPKLVDNKLELICSKLGCWVSEPIPELCKRVLDCPGCGSGSLCPPNYQLVLSGLEDIWTVEVVDGSGKRIQQSQRKRGGDLEVTFRPDKNAFSEKQIGDYFLIFKMGAKGEAGRSYPVQLKIKPDTAKP